MPLRDVVAELAMQDAESERELIAKTLAIHEAHAGGAGYAEVMAALSDLRIRFPEHYLPVDEAARVELYQARRAAGLESRRMQLTAEHPEMDEAAVARLLERIDEEGE